MPLWSGLRFAKAPKQTKDGARLPLTARRPWVTIALWFLLLAAAVPLLFQVTDHLGSGGFSAPHSVAAKADATVGHLVQPASVPTTLIAGISPSRLQRMAKVSGMPAPWLHALGRSSEVLVPGQDNAAAKRFLGLARRNGASLTAVNSDSLGQAVSHQAIQAFSSSTVVAVPALLILLLLVFGAVLPALLPPVPAGAGTVLTLAVVAIVERYVPLSVYLLQIVSFLALGVGVDYALFVSTRFRSALEAGAGVEEALSLAMRTSGRSVLFSGLAVALAIGALVLGGTAYWRGMALGGGAAVASVLLVTHTLLPPLLRLMGRRASLGRIRFAMPEWRLWRILANWATSRPGIALTLGLLVLAVPAVAAPAMRASIPADIAAMLPQSSPLARAQKVEQQVRGAGEIAPFVVALSLPESVTSPSAWQTVGRVTDKLRAMPGVKSVASPSGRLSPEVLAASAASPRSPLRAFVSGPRSVDLFVTPASGPDSQATLSLLGRMQASLGRTPGAQVSIGGQVAAVQEFNSYLAARLPAMAVAVVLVALLVLWLATGSLLQAVIGVLMNALVTLATAGILVTVIERGAFGVTPQPLNLAVTPLVFVMLFGLSMDYEVILLHRIQERLRQGDAPRHAATHAVATTGGMITGAGLIMVAVVAALLVSPFEILQTLAIGLVSAVLLDTLVVRTFLVPAAVTLLGRHAFWPRLHQPRHLAK
jgi:RND superfamily putative drug exporter